MLYLIRFGEIATKATKTRRRFTKILVNNIKDALRMNKIEHEIKVEWSRIFLRSDKEETGDILKRIFGIYSFSPVYEFTFNSLREIIEKGEEFFRDRIRGKKFAVRARRTGSHPFSSVDIERKLGAKLLPYGSVDLTNPEITAHVEIRDSRAFFFVDVIRGPGGLPIGTEGKAVLLISGGFDSAVAAWFMLKRGVMVDYVFCNLGGCVHEEGVLRVAKILTDKWSYGYDPKIHIVNFFPLVREMQEKTPVQYWNVILKRLMYRVADRIGRETGAEGIVTGEAIGQVSSQTLRNLRVAEAVTEFPLLRPLLSFDKEEIIKKSREIGTYSVSSKMKEYCAVVPEHPVTRASFKKIEDSEKNIDFSILERVIKDRRVIDLKTFDLKELVPLFEIEEIPEGAVLVDIREEEEYRRWHPEGALHISFVELLNNPDLLERDKIYILYCNYGIRSAEVAKILRDEGVEAYSFKGGIEGLKRYLQTLTN
jgi:thiamine biosynthesis protein ThiI